MKYIEKLIKNIQDGFQKNKGKGSVYVYPPANPLIVAYSILVSLKNKRADSRILIILDTFNRRQEFMDLLNHALPDRNNYDYYINNTVILTKNFANSKYSHTYNEYIAVITVGINEDANYILAFENVSKFTLCILTENKMDNNFINTIRTKLPDINTNVNSINLTQDRLTSPVEEMQYAITLSDKDREFYTKCDNYIKDAMTIFGDIDTINKCRIGDSSKNLSAMDVRLAIANANGWSSNLDTSSEFNAQIDSVYNPNAIAEKAELVYKIIHDRRNICFDCESKIDTIKSIVHEEINKGHKVLIISKHGEFASAIAKHLNEGLDKEICGEYHDSVEERYLTNENSEVIKYTTKSSPNYGKPKVFKAKAISSLYMNSFNSGNINVLSIKNSSNMSLEIAVDSVILTSPLLDSISEIKARFTKVDFATPTIVYMLYCKSTIEEISLSTRKLPFFISVKTADEFNIKIDEENGDICL